MILPIELLRLIGTGELAPANHLLLFNQICDPKAIMVTFLPQGIDIILFIWLISYVSK